MKKRRKVYVLYHFYKPDDVVSAVHFSELSEALVDRGWDVTVLTSSRYCRNKGRISPASEILNGVHVERCWRPDLSQSGNVSRMINSLWIQAAWLLKLRKLADPDAVIVGTDPQFSQFMLPVLKRVTGGAKLFYWSFDVYPEAVQAESPNRLVLGLANLIARIMPRLYRPVDVMVDIGDCMRGLLRKYGHAAREATLIPWALSEPEYGNPVNEDVRRAMFGDDVRLGVLYSGSLGMAHEYGNFLALARLLRTRAPGIVFAFSSTGNRMKQLLEELTPDDTNIRILPFASLEELNDRLNAADIHALSLRENWTGIVVPSKFFGSLAAGKPLLYSGSRESCIGRWIREFDLGLLVDDGNVDDIADKLVAYSENPSELERWKKTAYGVYHERFSKKTIQDGWSDLLESELSGVEA